MTAQGPVSEHVHLGRGFDADADVIVGYRSGRDVPDELHIGEAARLRSGTVVYAGSVIGDHFETGHHVVVREESRIGDGVSVWSNSVIDYGCTLDSSVKVHSNCYVSQFTTIGEGAFLAPGVTLANDLYPGVAASAAAMAGPTIGAHAHIGVNVTVLPYVNIGEGAIIGAGSVVTRDIPPKMVAYGSPAVPARAVEELPDITERLGARRPPRSGR